MERHIYCDLDGVLLDFTGAFLEYLQQYYPVPRLWPRDVTVYDMEKCLALKLSVTESAVREIISGFLHDPQELIKIKPVEPVLRAVRYILSEVHPRQFSFATARTGIAAKVACRSLEAMGFPETMLELIKEKQLLVKQGHIVIDDKPPVPELLEMKKDGQAVAGDLFLIRQPWNQQVWGGWHFLPVRVHHVWPCDADDIGGRVLRALRP